MALMLAICSAQPNWMPRKPKLMFQISQNVRRGFVLGATAAVAAAGEVMGPQFFGVSGAARGGATGVLV